MSQSKVENLNVTGMQPLVTPLQMKRSVPAPDAAVETIATGRDAIAAVLEGRDPRFLVICGPCSIHDTEAGTEYAKRLSALAAELGDRLLIVMRTYFEKPRTTTGWKGLINDPRLDGSNDIATGIRTAREVLMRVAELGLPTATEMLDPIVPQYISDLVAWASIGARTTESQTHREMSSGLSMPVGFKNSTDGNTQVAINAMLSSHSPHHFLGIDEHGCTCIVETKGNPHGHLILRGGSGGPNYDEPSVAAAAALLEKAGLPARIIVDCSHANTSKKPENQPIVLREVVRQRAAGQSALKGAMLESHLVGGRQELQADLSAMTFGQSITDGCLGWEETEAALRETYAALEGIAEAQLAHAK
ncbi:MAG: 3-deoxy-7-phosphoheptulonate synthase [Candidatus Hydrogenedens sp.]|nr:3-deoxy-7-phosphoheptulonate synthase [Candidatus Hydrogenedens sp.]